MMFETVISSQIDDALVKNYFEYLVSRFFKILPIREQNEQSLSTYLQSFQLELVGCKNFICAIKQDAMFLSLISILQYLIDNPDCSVKSVRREVFNAISICNRLKSTYFDL